VRAALLVILALTAGPAFAQSNLPPAPPAQSGTAKTISTGFGSVGWVNDSTGLIIQGGEIEAIRTGVAGAESAATLKGAVKFVGVRGVVLQGTKMATDLYRGDTAAVIESSAGLLIDAGVTGICDASGAAMPACNLTYAGAKVIGTAIDAGYSAVTRSSIGADTYDGIQWARHQVDPSSELDNPAYWAKAETDMRAQHAAAAAGNLAANNENARGQAILAEAQTKWAEIARGGPQFAVYQSEFGYGGGVGGGYIGGGAQFTPAAPRRAATTVAPHQVSTPAAPSRSPVCSHGCGEAVPGISTDAHPSSHR